MEDVAALAGVSLKTVSRVVNGEPRVAAETAEQVLAAVRELGFRSNTAAAALAGGRRLPGIGLIIENVADPFYARLAAGVEQVAREHGCAVLVSSSEEDIGRERDIVLSLIARSVDGLILVPAPGRHDYLAEEIAAGLPIVFADRPPRGVAADCVLTDNVTGACEGTASLLTAGCRRLAFIGNDTSVYTSAARLEGFRSAHANAGIAVDESLVTLGPADTAAAEAVTTRLLDLAEPPDGIFAQNNLLSIGAWRALVARRRQGSGVRLIGFDDFPLADVLRPPVSVVAQDPVALGREAATLLFSRRDDPGRPPRTTVLPARVVLRG
jgi:LacI family transcriptional regulator